MIIVELHDGVDFHVGYVRRLGQWVDLELNPINFEPTHWRPALINYSYTDRHTAMEYITDNVEKLRSIGVDPAPIKGIRPKIIKKGYLE